MMAHVVTAARDVEPHEERRPVVAITPRGVLLAVNAAATVWSVVAAIRGAGIDGVLVALVVGVSNMLFIWLGAQTRNHLLSLYGGFELIYCILRLPHYMDWTRSTVGNAVYPEGFTPPHPDALPYALTVFVVYHLAGGLLAGFIGSIVRLPLTVPRPDDDPVLTNMRRLLVLFAVLQAVTLGELIVLRIGYRFNGGQSGWWTMVLQSDLLFNLLTLTAFMQWAEIRRRGLRGHVLLVFAVTVLVTVLWGSRSGLYRIGELWMILALVLYPTRRFRVRPVYVAAATLIGVLALVTFFLANAARDTRLLGRTGSNELRSSQESAVRSLDAPALRRSLSSALERANVLDYIVFEVEMEHTRYARTVNVANSMRALANLLVPGDVFPGALISGRAWRVDYVGLSTDEAWLNYNTDVVGATAMSVALGNPATGFAFLLAIMFGGALLLRLAYDLSPGPVRPYVATLGYVFFFKQVLNAMGVDMTLFTVYLWLVELAVAVFWLPCRFRGWVEPFVKRARRP